MKKSCGVAGLRSNCRPGRLLPRALRVLVAVVMTAAMSLSFAGVASAARPGAPAGAGAHPAGACHGAVVKVRGTGVPAVDRRHLQQAITLGESSRQCVLLLGHFNVGFCVWCISITGPVTLSGQADPAGPSPDPRQQTVISATGGVGSVSVDEPPGARAGLVRVSDLWFRGTNLIGLTMRNFYRGTLEIDHNRVTDIAPVAGFRFGIGGGTDVTPGSEVLAGKLIVRNNYVNSTAGRPPLLDDNGIALQGATFSTINLLHNTAITDGESLEIEDSTGSDYNVSGNVVSTTSHLNSRIAQLVDTVGFPRLHGGHPAALKLAGNDVARVTIENNNVTLGGGSHTMVCIMQYLAGPSGPAAASSTRISGNSCTMRHIFAGILGGWAGSGQFFPPGPMDNATVTNNTLTGTASFGISMMDFTVPAAPANNLVNTSNGNVFTRNDLSHFIPGVASLYLGLSTHNNTFIGDPHGPVINLGKHNHIVKPPGAITVVASGLESPRGLAFSPGGDLYVGEAGTGGPHRTTPNQCRQVGPTIGPATGGFTARISKISPTGRRTTVVSGLPSYSLRQANWINGVSDLGFIHGRLTASEAGGGCSHGLPGTVEEVFRVNANGTTSVANLSAYSLSHPGAHPDPTDYEPDGAWTAMAQLGNDLYATESNHQELARITPDGKVTGVVDFSKKYPDHVFYQGPTGVAAYRGALYVGSLGNYPTMKGSANVFKVDPKTGKYSVFIKNLTTVVALAFGHDGTLFVLENSARRGFPTPGYGKIVMIKGHQRKTIATGLDLPMGMTFGPGGALYISDRGFGFPPGQGRILKVDVRRCSESSQPCQAP